MLKMCSRLLIPLNIFYLISVSFILNSFYRTREIKPNQTDIGRKITKKITPTNVRTMSSVSQPSSRSSFQASKRSLDVDRNSSDGNNLSHLTSHQQIPTINSHSSYNSMDHHHDSLSSSSSYHHHHNNALNGVVCDDIDQQRSNIGGHNLNRNSGQQNHRNPDIMRRPIK